jgi:TPR repeat protein
MRGKREFGGRVRGIAMVVAIFCLQAAGSALGQQFVSRDSAGEMTCLQAIRMSNTGLAGTACDHHAVEELAKSGHAFAENQLGIESALVLSPEKTIRDARKWFEKAAGRGYAPAQVNLGVLYINGWGVEKNYGTALYWLKTAADQGNARAHTNLGILYMNGWGVRQDYAESLKHFQFAAEHGEAGAMVDLGILSDRGLGMPQDKAVALHWYQLAAEQGDALGQNNLADMYLRGEGVEQNFALAQVWFEKAAEQGNTGARIKLGYLYASGRAGHMYAEKAYALILAAKLAGDARGEEYLAPLEKQLSGEQRAEAKEKAHALLSTKEQSIPELAFVR